MESEHASRPIPEFSGEPWEPERPIPEGIYPVIDTDLARDNLENCPHVSKLSCLIVCKLAFSPM